MERFIKNLAKGAGAIVRKGFSKKMKITSKSGPWDLLTKYDLAADRFIIEKIKRRFPRHGILSEESGQVGSSKDFWIIDPIDGTTAFTRGIHQFTICIAYASNNDIKFSAIYDPIAGELFFAAKGKGAFLNSRAIRITSNTELNHSWAAEHIRRDTRYAFEWRKFQRLVFPKFLYPMRTGSVQLSGAYTASGRYDILISGGLNSWDYAAFALLIKEAGGKVTTIDGKPYRWDSDSILAANPILHKKMLTAMKKV